MKKPIIIDIENIDTKAIKKQERFLQIDAYQDLSIHLQNELKRKIKTKKDISKKRIHNTVLVDGKRGSGKTQFLLSIKNYLKINDKRTLKKLYFFSAIDPTLLHDNENFLIIIIAKMLNNLETNGYLKELKKNEKKEFYKILSSLSEAIDGIISNKNKDISSLECISQDQTSLRLEIYLHEFFKIITQIVKKKRLIILIDDIDMAFDKGFEVLEVIRKYLSSYYVIPIVTGDICLYEAIICDYFSRKINDKNCFTTEKRNIICSENIHKLTLDYLIKVLPQHLRVKIKNLLEISETKNIYFKYKKNIFLLDYKSIKNVFLDSDIKSSIKNEDIQSIKDTFFNYAIEIYEHNESAKLFVENLFSDKLRRILQFLNGEYSKDKFGIISEENIENIEYKYNLTNLGKVETEKVHLREGLRYLRNNEFDKAIKYFKKSINIKENENTYFYMGNAYKNKNEYNNAINYYKKAIDLNHKSESAYYNLGNTYWADGKYEDSKKAYTEVIKINPNNFNSYSNLGAIHEILNEHEDSKSAYKMAIEINPNHIDSYLGLALLYIDNNQFDLAEFQYREIIKIDDNNYEANNNLGYLLIQLKNNKEAEIFLKKAKQLDENNFIPYINLLTINLLENKFIRK